MLSSLVESAFVYAYPLYATALTRYRAVQDGQNMRRHAPNTLLHERGLSDYTTRWITSPNNDTLYSNAWLDLSAGPVRICVDPMPAGRYWSVAMLDMWTNHFAMLGQRLDGTGPVDVTVVAPGMPVPADADRVIRAPGLDVWLFVRNLVDGPHDLPVAHGMQDRITIRVLRTPHTSGDQRLQITPGLSTDPASFLAMVNESLARNPPPAEDAQVLREWSEVGLVAGDLQPWGHLSQAARAAWHEVIVGAHERLRLSATRGRRDVQGWLASAPEMGQFGPNHALRASVALGGLGALESTEAMYFVRITDDAGVTLDGQQRYVLKVPAQGIPTDSFWSFTMYEPTAAGQRFFVDNPIRRYSVGNRTPGLHFEADGSLHIILQRQAPVDERERANWLPTPGGVFQIALRAYIPQPALREGRAVMPCIVQAPL